MVNDLRFEGPGRIDTRVMNWYVEFTATGLVDELASTQLFGIVKGRATGVEAARGVFDRAKTDRHGHVSDGGAITGGVVLLDEIADINSGLQAKLLPVLSGGRFYPVGGEGDPEYERTFDGVIIAATWQELGPARMRQDLLSRISNHTIIVPGISERIEDLPAIIESVRDLVVKRYRDRVKGLIPSDSLVDRGYWKREAEASIDLTPDDQRILAGVDWSRHGDMRGLVNAIERIAVGREEAAEVVDGLQPLSSEHDAPGTPTEWLYLSLMNRRPSDDGLLGHVKDVERIGRAKLKNDLIANPARRARIAAKLGIDDGKLIQQLRQLDRTRRTVKPGSSS